MEFLQHLLIVEGMNAFPHGEGYLAKRDVKRDVRKAGKKGF